MKMLCAFHGETEGRLTENGAVCASCARKALKPVFTPTFRVLDDGNSIKCLRCGLVSWDPMDVLHRYCGECGYHPDIEAS